MDDLQKHELARATERLDAAQLLLREGKYEDAINRAYYSMFHCTRALLYGRKASVRTHRGLIVKFGEEFVKSGEIAREYATMLSSTQTLRENADYGSIQDIDAEDARTAVRDAKAFLEMSRRFIAKGEGDGESPSTQST